jgi:hypothetical protein
MSEKKIPCVYFNSAEGCTKTAEECLFLHSRQCNHIGCIKRGKEWTHTADSCGFLEMNKKISLEGGAEPLPKSTSVSSEVQPPSEKTLLCEKIYDKLIKKISGKITGMFQDGLDISDLQSIIDEPDISNHEWFKLALKTLLE